MHLLKAMTNVHSHTLLRHFLLLFIQWSTPTKSKQQFCRAGLKNYKIIFKLVWQAWCFKRFVTDFPGLKSNTCQSKTNKQKTTNYSSFKKMTKKLHKMKLSKLVFGMKETLKTYMNIFFWSFQELSRWHFYTKEIKRAEWRVTIHRARNEGVCTGRMKL